MTGSTPAGEPRRGRLFYGWIIVVSLGTGAVVTLGANIYLFSLIIVPVEQELHWSRAELSSVVALSSLVFGIAGHLR